MGRHTRSAFQWLWTQFLVFVRQVLPPSTFPQPLIRIFRSQKPSEAGTPQDFTFSQPCLSPVRQHLRVHLHISVLLTGRCSFHLAQDPHLPSPIYTIILHTAGCAWVCFPFIMSLQFNEGSRAVGGWLPLWTQERRQPTAAPLSCPRRVVTAPLPPPFPNLYSVHSQGHKSVVVGMYYEEINIYHISFQEGE